MADFEAPSFSLGLDLDPGPEPGSPSRRCSSGDTAPGPSSVRSLRVVEDDDDIVPKVMELYPDRASEKDAPVLRRLRRGPKIVLQSPPWQQSVGGSCDPEDEIEAFSSEEGSREGKKISTPHQSVCSNSKFPVHGHNALKVRHSTDRRKEQASSCLPAASSVTDNDKFIFPKLTVSPFRRFQLLDTDSDGSSSEDFSRADDDSHMSKDFCPIKNVSVPTPALDEVCEEYFRTLKGKDKDVSQKPPPLPVIEDPGHFHSRIGKNVEQQWDLGNKQLSTAHRYYFNDDPRIRELVRNRLPNFFPLDVLNNNGSRQLDAASIDYMKQFSHKDGSKSTVARSVFSHVEGSEPKITNEINAGKCLGKGKKRLNEPRTAEMSRSSESWVNPKSSPSAPRNAGKRRVHADGNSVGSWFTASGGRRVYVTKTGQELTGRSAYLHYKKVIPVYYGGPCALCLLLISPPMLQFELVIHGGVHGMGLAIRIVEQGGEDPRRKLLQRRVDPKRKLLQRVEESDGGSWWMHRPRQI